MRDLARRPARKGKYVPTVCVRALSLRPPVNSPEGELHSGDTTPRFEAICINRVPDGGTAQNAKTKRGRVHLTASPPTNAAPGQPAVTHWAVCRRQSAKSDLVDVGLGVLILQGLAVVNAEHTVCAEPELVRHLGVGVRAKVGELLLEKVLGALRHAEQGLELPMHASTHTQT